ncbi:MAG TPA: hypothetical protein VLI92_01875 [Candidatus Saccharimonadales bacterium]|nr:hypothetical protein [Candidatus Saccharimonadales bacterium]
MRVKLGIFVKYLFETSLFLYIICIVLDLIKTGFVSNVFDLNILLAVVLVSGVLSALLGYEEVTQIGKPTITDSNWYFIIGISCIGAVVIFIKTMYLGNISYFITGATFIISILLSYLVLIDDSE